MDDEQVEDVEQAEEATQDIVAMVSRHADGSDAQENQTVRLLDEDASNEADEAQLYVGDIKHERK